MDYFSTADHVVINGNTVPIPYPPAQTAYVGTLPLDSIVAESTAFTSVIQLQKSQLIRGVNNIDFYNTIASIGFPHIEIDVPTSVSYTYSDPPPNFTVFAHGFPVDTYVAPFSVGGALSVDSIGTKNPWVWYMDSLFQAQAASPNAAIQYTCDNSRAAAQHGTNRGLAYAELFINGASVAVKNLHGTPYATGLQFTFDSRALTNGQTYDIWIMCWGVDGGSGAFLYGFEAINDTWNRYTPMQLQITSGGSQAVPLNAQPQEAKTPFITAPPAPPQPVPAVRTFTPSGVSFFEYKRVAY